MLRRRIAAMRRGLAESHQRESVQPFRGKSDRRAFAAAALAIHLSVVFFLSSARAYAQIDLQAGTVAGHVTWNGAPVTGSSVTTIYVSVPGVAGAYIGSDGSYSIAGLSANTYQVSAYRNGCILDAYRLPPPLSVQATAGQTTTADIDITATSGRVTGAITLNGARLPDTVIKVPGLCGSWRSFSDGSFAHFLPAGSYTASVAATTFGPIVGSFTFPVIAGQTTSLTVGSTPVGSQVPVELAAALTNGGTTSLDITYANVTAPGQTSVTASVQGPPPPSGFKLGQPPVYYDVSTTALFDGGATLCFSWLEGEFKNEDRVRLWHYDNGVWQDVTTSVDPVANVACGTVASFSPFALFEPDLHYDFVGFFAPVADLPALNRIKAGSAVPVKFSLGGNFGLDVMATGSPASQSIDCSSSASVSSITDTVSAGESSLTFDGTSGQYTYVWKTDRAWAGSCRQLVLRFKDGTEQRSSFDFVR
jgi:hypothetical protein